MPLPQSQPLLPSAPPEHLISQRPPPPSGRLPLSDTQHESQSAPPALHSSASSPPSLPSGQRPAFPPPAASSSQSSLRPLNSVYSSYQSDNSLLQAHSSGHSHQQHYHHHHHHPNLHIGTSPEALQPQSSVAATAAVPIAFHALPPQPLPATVLTRSALCPVDGGWHDVIEAPTLYGLCWAVCCFPVGLVCCLLSIRQRCRKCGIVFGGSY